MSDRPTDLDRFEEALRRGLVPDLRRLWPRVKLALAACEWVTLSMLAHMEGIDRRTLETRIEGQPFYDHPAPRVKLVDRHRYAAWKDESQKGRRR